MGPEAPAPAAAGAGAGGRARSMTYDTMASAVAATVSTAAPAYMPPLLRPLAFCDAPNKKSTDAITVPILHPTT